MRFDFFSPTPIHFERGGLARLGESTRRFGDHALLLTGRSAMRRTKILDRALDSLRHAGVRVTLFEDVSPNPRSDEVDQAMDLARRQGCNVVIGLGGGSAMDAAKATAVAIGSGEESVGPLIGQTLAPSPTALPTVAVPTVAGSGAEVTKGAILTDIARGLRSGLRGSDVFPRLALVDPDLISSVPHEVVVETAFDAMTHSLETFIARRATPIGRALGERALGLLGQCFVALENGDRTPEVEESLCLASLLGGINVANSGSCLPHRLQQAMGSLPHVDTSHGRGLAALYPAWLRAVYPHASERLDACVGFLGGDEVHETLVGWLQRLDLPTSLGRLGVRQEDLEVILAHVTGAVENDPIEGLDATTMEAVLQTAL